jgi:universal stress protein A
MTTGCILHPTDFSETALTAEAQAIAMARALGAELLIIHVASDGMLYGETTFGRAELERVYEAQRAWAHDALAAREAAARAAGVAARSIVCVGVPAEEIVRVAAEEHPTMIVIGTHGRSGLGRLMLGSVTDRVIRMAPCPVLTVREAETPAGGA